MKRRARPVQVPGTEGRVNFDVGARAAPLPEMRAVYTSPEQDDPEARAAVVAWLARLLGRPREG